MPGVFHHFMVFIPVSTCFPAVKIKTYPESNTPGTNTHFQSAVPIPVSTAFCTSLAIGIGNGRLSSLPLSDLSQWSPSPVLPQWIRSLESPRYHKETGLWLIVPDISVYSCGKEKQTRLIEYPTPNLWHQALAPEDQFTCCVNLRSFAFSPANRTVHHASRVQEQ